MSAHDKLARTKFGDIEFPAEEHVVHSTGRKHLHEYWKSPGAAAEKGGRGPWFVTIRGLFHDRFPAYPDLYPNGMNRLRADFESQTTRKLVHPTFGTFDAWITDWRQTKRAKVRSGESVDLEFLEDQLTVFTATAIVAATTNVATPAAALASQLAAIQDQLALEPNAQSIFDAIQNTANSILAIRDTTNLYGNLVAAKIAQLTNLIQQADSLRSMQDPRAWPVVDAMRDLWDTANRTLLNLQQNSVQLQKYTVPQTMPLAMIAVNIYGDASKQSDLLSLNANVITSPLSVRAATVLNYYPAQ